MQKLLPLGDRVLLRRQTGEQKTPSGILIPDTAQEKPLVCDVVEVGNGVRDMHGTIHPLMVKSGDKVLITKLASQSAAPVPNNPDLIIIREGDILGIIEGS